MGYLHYNAATGIQVPDTYTSIWYGLYVDLPVGRESSDGGGIQSKGGGGNGGNDSCWQPDVFTFWM